jgi:hypothetical protein
MQERCKEQEVDVLRRLADLLRQAHSAASGENDKKSADMKKARGSPRRRVLIAIATGSFGRRVVPDLGRSL